MTHKMTVAKLCLDCAEYIIPRSPGYTEATGRLLFGTACAESLLTYRRQIGFHTDDVRGAWGLWQTEYAPVYDSVVMLSRKANLGERCINWLEKHGIVNAWTTMNGDPLRLMELIRAQDAVGCLFARLHYLRFPTAIPIKQEEQAAYWKRNYNTHLGAGTIPGYLEKWRQCGADTWETLVENPLEKPDGPSPAVSAGEGSPLV